MRGILYTIVLLRDNHVQTSEPIENVLELTHLKDIDPVCKVVGMYMNKHA